MGATPSKVQKEISIFLLLSLTLSLHASFQINNDLIDQSQSWTWSLLFSGLLLSLSHTQRIYTNISKILPRAWIGKFLITLNSSQINQTLIWAIMHASIQYYKSLEDINYQPHNIPLYSTTPKQLSLNASIPSLTNFKPSFYVYLPFWTNDPKSAQPPYSVSCFSSFYLFMFQFLCSSSQCGWSNWEYLWWLTHPRY